MKGKVLLFLGIVLFVSNLYSQTYRVVIKNYDYQVRLGKRNIGCDSGDNNLYFRLYYADGDFTEIYNAGSQGAEYDLKTDELLSIELLERPVKLYFYVSARGKQKKCKNRETIIENFDINNNCKSGSYSKVQGSDQTKIWISYDYEIHPIINLIKPSSDFIGLEDEFYVSVSDNSKGFLNANYNWEYQLVSSGTPNKIDWSAMPSVTNKQRSFSIKPSSFLTNNDVGKRLYIRLRMCDNLVSEDYIFFKLTRSAPHFNSALPNMTTCYDAIDGSVTFNFDRDLYAGEKLSISVTNTTNNSDYSKANIENDIINKNYKISDLPPGEYEARVLGFGIPAYEGKIWNTFTEDPTHKIIFTINKPSPVVFNFTKVDVWCNGGSDGELKITASGGQNFVLYEYLLRKVGETTENWIPFSSTAISPIVGVTETIRGLDTANYELKLRDAYGCIAKEIVKDGNGVIIDLGKEITKTFLIDIPKNPLSIAFTTIKEPSAFGFSDGKILAQITGGTFNLDKTYASFEWKHENGTVWTSVNTATHDGNDGWFLTLNNAIAGTYYLTVKDINYDQAVNKEGCTIVKAEFTLNQPPMLALSLTETNAISCNNANMFVNPSSDGELTVTATGGVPFSPLINGQYAYKYTWKKKNNLGVYQVIVGENRRVLSNIDAGEYAVNIVDANNITIGTYTNNVLVTATDTLYTLTQPELLQITFTKVDVFCNAGNDGSINATITGGTGDYTILWTNGASTEDIDTLVAGTYTIDVTDIKGCQAQANITIKEPENPLVINYTAFFAPTYTGATNGWIEATITGGTSMDSGKYKYHWKDTNGANLNAKVTETVHATSYVITLNNLGKGVYDLTIEDKNYSVAINKTNCTIVSSDYEIFEPAPLMARIELQQPISCNSANTYEDPFADGVLEVIAEGGVHLQPTDNNGLAYYYTWKKEINPGVWTVLTTQTTNIANNLDAGNYAVNIEDANGIIIGVYQNNLLVNATDVLYLFKEPSLLELSIEKQDVYCFNGSDAWAKIIVSGGKPPYTVLWSNGGVTEQISNLNQGVYEVAVSDSSGCHTTGSIQINQPTASISIKYTAFETPSIGGASDGWIVAQITGGTDFKNGSYTYYWQDANGGILNAQTTTGIVNGIFQIRLNKLPKGAYYLTIEDANSSLANTGDGCTIADNVFMLYDPIEAILSVHKPISCHGDNSFNNPFSDGALHVTVTGGVPFTEGQPYMYYWKKENKNGDFEDLNQNTNTAMGLSHGKYALNVADSRGVVIGVYKSLQLINPTDLIYYFQEPELLEVALSKTEISCDTGDNATATVTITGGIPPYKIEWSNGQDTATANNLIAGNYLVFITDARGCQVTGNIGIAQPGGLQITVLKEKHPTCFQGNDGSIELALSGGVPPYTIAWNTGETVTDIKGLSQGTYTFSLIDGNGCKAFKEIILVHPTKITIDLGADRTLCKDQTHEVDGSISDKNATYSWTSDNGFSATTPSITISKAGTYQVTVISALGCTASDSITFLYNDTIIDSEFLLSSQAYVNQDVIVFNVSSPKGASSKWIIPKEVAIIEKSDLSITLRFPKVATYELGLISTQGACYEEQYKNIVVEEHSGLPSPGDTNNPFIEEFTLSPNPNNGQFELYINLAESSQIAVRVFSIQGSFIFAQPNLASAEEYKISMSLNLATGTYFVVLETAKETRIKRMIIK